MQNLLKYKDLMSPSIGNFLPFFHLVSSGYGLHDASATLYILPHHSNPAYYFRLNPHLGST
ncbi:hypothetical protein, partial [Streptococcus pneumoniae]|uniref:hypothetical protein n=1 Tax=Streptococcus pneumoniae TaxID=1313 RepID=UPI00307E58AE